MEERVEKRIEIEGKWRKGWKKGLKLRGNKGKMREKGRGREGG